MEFQVSDSLARANLFYLRNKVTSEYEVEAQVLIADIYFSKTLKIWV